MINPNSSRVNIDSQLSYSQTINSSSRLWPEHYEHLRNEGFLPHQIQTLEDLGVRSLTKTEAAQLNLQYWNREHKEWDSSSGIYFPFTDTFGQLRCDNPPVIGGKSAKYLTPRKLSRSAPSNMAAFIPEGCKAVTEGVKDALSGWLHGGIITGAIAGIGQYKTLVQNSQQIIIFDADGWTNACVFVNLFNAGKWVNGKIVLVPKIKGEPKAGLCEYFKAGYSQQDYQKLLSSALQPEEFLQQLPLHWQDLSDAKLDKCIRAALKLAAKHLDPIQCDRLLDRIKKLTNLSLKSLKSKLEDYRTKLSSNTKSVLLKNYRLIEEALGTDIKLNLLRNELEYKEERLHSGRNRLFIATTLDTEISESDALAILGKLGEANSYHPVKDWLESIYQKFGELPIQLLEQPATLLLGTSNPLYDTYLRNQMVAAVARIYEPGCKVDYATILQGPQGIGKSRFWKILAGSEWFDDTVGSDLEDKDELAKLSQCWFQELGELDRVTSRKEASVVKAFLSRQADRYRAPYDRSVEPHPRRCVIVGSVNPNEFLVDDTGNRRFQIISIQGPIDLAKVEELRTQLWCAALSRYKRGDSWILSAEEEKIAAQENQSYEVTDIWTEAVRELLASKHALGKGHGSVILKAGLAYCVPHKLLEELGRPIGQQNQQDKRRLAKILRQLEWEPSDNPVRLPGFADPVRAWCHKNYKAFDEGATESHSIQLIDSATVTAQNTSVQGVLEVSNGCNSSSIEKIDKNQKLVTRSSAEQNESETGSYPEISTEDCYTVTPFQSANNISTLEGNGIRNDTSMTTTTMLFKEGDRVALRPSEQEWQCLDGKEGTVAACSNGLYRVRLKTGAWTNWLKPEEMMRLS